MKAENDAALARLEAVWKPAQVHQPNAVPATPVTPYAVVSAAVPGADNKRLDGSNGSEPNRIIVQAFGKTISEIAQPIEAARAAFLEHRLALAGYETTPAEAELTGENIYRDPDAGTLLTCTLTYTFHAYPA